jgi:hypothetical protein
MHRQLIFSVRIESCIRVMSTDRTIYRSKVLITVQKKAQKKTITHTKNHVEKEKPIPTPIDGNTARNVRRKANER